MTNPKPDLSATQIERVAVAIEQRAPANPRHRWLEDLGFIIAILMMITYGAAETLSSLGWRLGTCAVETRIPWVTLALAFMCILPKTVGRATTGKLWDAIAGRLGAKT